MRGGGGGMRGGGGGYGGGGMRGGGGYGGGGYGGGMGQPSFNRTPSFTTPGNIQRPNYGGGYNPGAGGGGWQGQMRPSTPAQRPNFPAANQPGVARPQTPGNRPNLGPGLNQPGGVPGGGRPPIAGPGNPGIRPPGGPGGPGYPGYPGGRPPGNIAGRPPGWNPPPAWGGRPGWNNHQAWVNGYWHGQNNNFWNNGGAFWGGMALGGLAGWGLTSSYYNWGYLPYSNPYAMVATQPVVIQQPVVVGQPVQQQVIEDQSAYDYSQPLKSAGGDAEAPANDPALQTFDAARASFKAGDYAGALKQTDEALKAMPNDAAVHEFRALCLFALKQYDQSAGVLYAVLSVGPGWDWTTLISLYPDVDTYTAQLRALEDYRSAHLDSPQARFVLAYHYLTQGHTDAAVREFNEVVKLEPNDALAKQIVAALTSAGDQQQPAAAQPQPDAAAQPGAPAQPPGQEFSLVGAWKAAPDGNTTIGLTLNGDGGFTWNVTQQGRTQPITGTYTYGSGVLTLARNGGDNDAMVGRVTWKDDSHFVFQALGGGANDPGLSFSK